MNLIEPSEAPNILPANTLLLHIGAQKTGTTALQNLPSRSQEQLRASNWTYLTTPNQINANKAIREKISIPYISRTKSDTEWDKLRQSYSKVQTEHVMISSEFLSSASDQDAKFVIQAFPGRTIYALLTVRNLHSAFSSQWQEQMQRWQETRTFQKYVTDALEERMQKVSKSHPFWLLHDYGAINARWEKLLGPEKVIILCLDKSDPNFLYNTVGGLLNLRQPFPKPLLDFVVSGRQNRSLGAEEAHAIFESYKYLEAHHPDFFNSKRRLLNWGTYKANVPLSNGARKIKTSASQNSIIESIAIELVEKIKLSSAHVVGPLDTIATSRKDVNGKELFTDKSAEIIDVKVAGALIASARIQGSQQRRVAEGYVAQLRHKIVHILRMQIHPKSIGHQIKSKLKRRAKYE